MDERELHNVLVLIETAQRANRSEQELVEIVERYFGEEEGVTFASPSAGDVLREQCA